MCSRFSFSRARFLSRALSRALSLSLSLSLSLARALSLSRARSVSVSAFMHIVACTVHVVVVVISRAFFFSMGSRYHTHRTQTVVTGLSISMHVSVARGA
jgi:hypothetical protein